VDYSGAVVVLLIWLISGTLPGTLKAAAYLKEGAAVCCMDSALYEAGASRVKPIAYQIGK
jgi:hypothetical protein